MGLNIPEKLFDLLLLKSYQELSIKEQDEFRSFLNQEEYESYRSILLDFKKSEEIGHTKTAVNTSRSRPMLQQILHYKVALYKAASAAILVGFATYFLAKQNFQNEIVEYAESQSIDSANQSNVAGISLAYDDYPEELIFDQ